MKLIQGKVVWIVLAVLCLLFSFIEAEGKGDFFIFLSAASDLDKHTDIFEARYVDGYHYYYSVLFALFLKPFVHLPFFWLKFVWLLLNCFLFLHMVYLLSRSSLLNYLSQKQKAVFVITVFLFSSRFFWENIHSSQITILILWCCIYGLKQITENKPVRGALLLAIGINIKLLPLVLLPYLLYRGYFKAVVYVVLFYVTFMFLPSVFIEHEYNLAMLKTWMTLVNPANQVHVLDVDERSFHGLSTLLSTLLVKEVPDVYALPLKRNIADVSLQTLSLVLNVVRLGLVIFTLFFVSKRVFKPSASRWQQAVETGYILLIIPLIFPHQQHYAFLFAIPAVACCTYYRLFLNGTEKHIYTISLIVIFLTFNLKLLVGEWNHYYDHFKILTYGSLLLIPLLARAWKKGQTLIPV